MAIPMIIENSINEISYGIFVIFSLKKPNNTIKNNRSTACIKKLYIQKRSFIPYLS